MSGIKDIAALDAKLASMSIGERKDLLNAAVSGLHNMVGERFDLGKRLLDRQAAGKPNLGTTFKAKGGIIGLAEGGLSGPQYKIDPQYYNSPEYEELMKKRREANKTGGNVSGFAMTYSPYFGMSNNTSIKQDDMAYEAYVKRIGGNPKADFGSVAFTGTKGVSTPDPTPTPDPAPEPVATQAATPVSKYDSVGTGQELRDMGIARRMPESYVNALSRQQIIQALEDSDAGRPLPFLYPQRIFADPAPTSSPDPEEIATVATTQAAPEPAAPSPVVEALAQQLTQATPEPTVEAITQAASEPATTTTTTPAVQQTFDPNATTSNVAAENRANTQSGTAATQPSDTSLGVKDIAEAAAPVLGVAAVDAILGDGEIDWKNALTTGVGIGQALGLDAFDKLGSDGQVVGYQGGIPSYAATRRQVPVDYSTGRRPGAGGRRYFTDMRYTAPQNAGIAAQAAAQDATALQQMNQANPLNQPPVSTMAAGGYAYAPGGLAGMMPSRYLNSAADGMADTIPSSIDNKDPAALSGGEFVVAADVVSGLGNGNSNAGAQQLYNMMDRVRKARTGTTKQGKQIKPQSVMPV